MKIFLKILRIFAIVVVSIVLLNIIIFITLSIPYVQNKAKDFALSKVKPIVKRLHWAISTYSCSIV